MRGWISSGGGARALARQAGLTATGPFNLGEGEYDYRVPDRGLHREWTDRVWYPTAALVVEIVSPADESYQKLAFYAARGVDEVALVDREKRAVDWLRLAGEAVRAGRAQWSRSSSAEPSSSSRSTGPSARSPAE